MKILIILVALVVLVLLCEKFEKHLPQPVRWIYAQWKRFAHALGIVMSFLILTILWIVGFGPYAIIRRIVLLPKMFRKEPLTNWVDASEHPVEAMEQPF